MFTNYNIPSFNEMFRPMQSRFLNQQKTTDIFVKESTNPEIDDAHNIAYKETQKTEDKEMTKFQEKKENLKKLSKMKPAFSNNFFKILYILGAGLFIFS